VLARLAENIFWAGRYLERAEDTARLLDVTYHGLLESPQDDPAEAWTSLLNSLGQLPSYEERGAAFTESAVTRFLVVDQRNPGSVASSVAMMRENVRSLREQVSAELWEAVNTFHLEMASRDLLVELQRQRYELFAMVKQRCQLVSGVADQTMPRDDGWRFYSVGRQLERAIMGARLLDVYFQDLARRDQVEFHRWRNLLRAAAAFEAYNRRAGAVMRPTDAVDFLLLADDHPRSILFCLRAAEAELRQLDSSRTDRPGLWALGRVRALLEFSDPADRDAERLGDFLTALILDVQGVIATMTEEYFATARPAELHSIGRA
jgi:uncharacterized alpha-E superfamily protein